MTIIIGIMEFMPPPLPPPMDIIIMIGIMLDMSLLPSIIIIMSIMFIIWLSPPAEILKHFTSLPYFEVKLSCVCLMFAYRKK